MDAVNRRPARSLPDLAVVVAALVALLVLAGGSRPATALAAGSGTDTTAVALADDEDVSDCISALPKPGCDRRDTDAMQVAVLLVMTAGVAFIGWRIGRAVRSRDHADTPPSSSA